LPLKLKNTSHRKEEGEEKAGWEAMALDEVEDKIEREYGGSAPTQINRSRISGCRVAL
jgi:hypothetical protein